MTAFAPDLPDWTTESSAGTLYGQDFFLAPDESVSFGLSGIGSYVARFQSNTSNNDVLAALTYFITGLGAIALQQVIITGQQSPFGPVLFQYESPSYGSGIVIQNLDSVNPLNLSIVSSNRNVNQPRYLNDLTTGSVFETQPGAGFTGGTPQTLFPVASTCNGLPVNVQQAFSILSSGDGVLEFWYKAADFSQRKLTIAQVVAATVLDTVMALPFCVGQLVFTPTTTDAFGSVTVQAYPAYT